MGSSISRSALSLLALLAICSMAFAESMTNLETMDEFWRQFEQQIHARHDGTNADFTGRTQPAYVWSSAKSLNDQILEADSRLISEAQEVYEAFATAPASEKKSRVRLKVHALDRANLESKGDLNTYRAAFLIRVDHINDANPVRKVMQELATFESTPKEGDIYYRYSNSQSLIISRIEEARGTSTGYLSPMVSALIDGQPTVIKKCRRAEGSWQCNTKILDVSTVIEETNGPENAMLFLESLINTNRTGDPAIFRGGPRTVNTANGFTGATLVVRHDDLILLYDMTLEVSKSGSRVPPAASTRPQEYLLLLRRLQNAFGKDGVL